MKPILALTFNGRSNQALRGARLDDNFRIVRSAQHDAPKPKLAMIEGLPTDDHPFDALERQFNLEDASISPVSKVVPSIPSFVPPLPWPIDKAVARIKERLGSDSIEQIRLMVETCMSEVRRLDKEIERLRERLSREEEEQREATSKELLLDAARRAEATRDIQRVKRIGLILAPAMAEPGTVNGDEFEELMRVATELSDCDTDFLRELASAH